MASANSEIDPWSLVMRHEYDRALALFERERPTWTNEDWLKAAGMGTALLCLRRYAEAAIIVKEAHEMSRVARLRSEGRYLDTLGGALWLANQREQAAAAWGQSVQGLLAGTIVYADGAGGVSNALLLRYAGISLVVPTLIAEAEKLLKKCAKRKTIANWPGPLASHVLQKAPMAQILINKFGTDDLEILSQRAPSDILLRRELSQALFCWATSERADGKETECARLMTRCADLLNPLLEIEWYLARGEVERQNIN